MSTIDTQHLIEQLAGEAAPVGRLPSPWVRTAFWLAVAAVNLVVFVLAMSPRRDLGAAFADPAFIVEQLAALATGITAGLAAFGSVVPGFDRRLLLLPLLPLAVWLASVGTGCVTSWIRLGPAGLTVTPDWACVPAIALIGLAPAVIIAFMLRRGAPLTPRTTAALGGLAAAGLGSFALRLCHAEDASVMVLIWQVGTVALLTAAAGAAGRWLLGSRILTRCGR
ncbi:MAG: NrsF family protein [Steroidobacteraceae bacterium]